MCPNEKIKEKERNIKNITKARKANEYSGKQTSEDPEIKICGKQG